MRFDILNSTSGQWVSIVPYIKWQGLKYSRNDVDGSNAGRTIEDALMIRDRLATKAKWNMETIPLKADVAQMIEDLLMPEFFSVRTDYGTPGVTNTYEVYSNNVNRNAVIWRDDGSYYVTLTFPIVER